MLCPAHDPGADGPAGEAELRSVVSVLLREIYAEAELCDFIRLPGRPDYELRVGCPKVVAKWVIVPEGIVRRAAVNDAARRTLRNVLATVVLIQRAQRSFDRARELLATVDARQEWTTRQSDAPPPAKSPGWQDVERGQA
jgi:hypothetical protein